MLQWIRNEWGLLHGLWILLRLSPKERQAVVNTSPETMREIDAMLEKRREKAKPL